MARRILIENTGSGNFKDVLNTVFDILFGKTELDVESFAIDFRGTTSKFYKDYTQVGAIAFTKHAKNTIDNVGHVVYVKVTSIGGAITFSSDFVEVRNDYAGVAGDYDVWFAYLPDGKIGYSVIARP